MRNPNGYGSVINLGKGRRKPWGARITVSKEYDSKTDKIVQKYKYIGYAETRKEAYQLLAEYNAGAPIKDNKPLSSAPTFSEIWKSFYNAKFNGPKESNPSTARNYTIAYNRFETVHNKKMINITSMELQCIFDMYVDKSKATTSTMKTVINQMYRYAKKYYGIDDISKELEYEYTKNEESIHSPFTNDEIDTLWSYSDDYRAQFILMMIYSGLRPQEFVTIRTNNVNLDENYFIAGMKTAAGKNRLIPIHSKTKRFFELNFHPDKEYLICKSNFKKLTYRDKRDNLSYDLFVNTIWTPYMNEIGMNHLAHDPRHTFASLMDNAGASSICLKKIMGHAQTDDKGNYDVTSAVYIHKTVNQLREEIEKI